MRQKHGTRNAAIDKTVKDIHRATRKCQQQSSMHLAANVDFEPRVTDAPSCIDGCFYGLNADSTELLPRKKKKRRRV